MDIRSDYGNKDADRLFCFFMRTALRIQDNRSEKLVIDVKLEEPLQSYLELAMNLFLQEESMASTDIILQTELLRIVKESNPDRKQLLNLTLIREISEHMRFDESCFDYLLRIRSLWNEEANDFAVKTFYCHLPIKLLKEYDINQQVRHLTPEMMEPDNF